MLVTQTKLASSEGVGTLLVHFPEILENAN